jgi:hypothetical protein
MFIINRPQFLDHFLAPYTWLSIGIIIKPRDATMDPAIIDHEACHLQEQWSAGILVSALLLPFDYWALLGLPIGVLVWLALWRLSRSFRLAAEVRGIRDELRLTPHDQRDNVALAYAIDLAGPRYHYAAKTINQALDLLTK